MAKRATELFTQGLSVEFYDLISAASLHRVDGDCEFFFDLAKQAKGPVLELAAGTGRVAWFLAEAGINVVGLEISQAMIDRAEAKRALRTEKAQARASFLRGDMSNFDLGRQFSLIVCPFRAFQHLLTPTVQREALTCIARHLAPGGRLVLDLFDPRLDYLLPGSDGPPRQSVFPNPDDGGEVRIVLQDRQLDMLEQIVRERWHFEVADQDGDVVSREEQVLRLRWSYRWEMRYLLELSGYLIEAEYSDFKASPPAYAAEQVWVAKKP